MVIIKKKGYHDRRNFKLVKTHEEAKMKLLNEFIEQKENNNENGLLAQLEGWIRYRDSGDYNAWNNYQPNMDAWNKKEESDLVIFLLERLFHSSNLLISTEGVHSEFVNNEDYPMGLKFSRIVHLFAVASIVYEQHNKVGKSYEDSFFYNDNNFNVLFVNSSLPGPCLVYLGVIKDSSLSNLEKMKKIRDLILKFSSKKELFGSLGHLVLKIALQEYNILVENAPQNGASLNKAALKKIEELQKEVDEVSLEKIELDLTILDKYILTGLKINFPLLQELNYKQKLFTGLFKDPNEALEKPINRHKGVKKGFFHTGSESKGNNLVNFFEKFCDLNEFELIISQSSEKDKQGFRDYIMNILYNNDNNLGPDRS